MRRREKLFWLCTGAILIVLFLSIIPSHYEICNEAKKAQAKDCASYQVAQFLWIKIPQFLDVHNWLITALFAGLVTLFTWRLWQATNELRVSTDKLWYAGERGAIIQRTIGEAQVRAYVSIKSTNIYFIGDDGMPLIDIVAFNSGQSPAINFVWAPEVYYLSEKVEEVVKDVHPEWAEQPGLDIHSASEISATYVLDGFILAEKIAIEGVVPDRIAVSVTIHYIWTDVFGESFMDYASFGGMAEIGDVKANRKRHPLNTSPWFCRLHPIAKGEPWSGIAVKAPGDAEDNEKEPENT